MWYRYVACAHAGTPCKAMPRLGSCARVMVNSAVHSGDSYKTENADNGKVKSWDTRTTNCEAGTRKRSANLFIRVLPCRCRHPLLSRTSVFSLVTSHKPFFTLPHKHNTCTQHSGQDLCTRNAYRRALTPPSHLACRAAPCTSGSPPTMIIICLVICNTLWCVLPEWCNGSSQPETRNVRTEGCSQKTVWIYCGRASTTSWKTQLNCNYDYITWYNIVWNKENAWLYPKLWLWAWKQLCYERGRAKEREHDECERSSAYRNSLAVTGKTKH